MKEFFSFYRWGMNMKFHMSIYTIALLSVKSVVNLLQGSDVVSIWTMIEMVVVSMVLAICETFLFPEEKELPSAALRNRTVVWAVLLNVLFLGGSLFFHWFSGVPAWGAAALIAFLEGGAFAMWIGMHVALKKDTARLNRKLKVFQEE